MGLREERLYRKNHLSVSGRVYFNLYGEVCVLNLVGIDCENCVQIMLRKNSGSGTIRHQKHVK
jgi:hypothetical protein